MYVFQRELKKKREIVCRYAKTKRDIYVEKQVIYNDNLDMHHLPVLTTVVLLGDLIKPLFQLHGLKQINKNEPIKLEINGTIKLSEKRIITYFENEVGHGVLQSSV